MALLALVCMTTGCPEFFNLADESSTGAITGRVVDLAGLSVGNVRIVLDDLEGRSTVTDPSGDFFIGGVRDGDHIVYAFDAATNSAGAVQVQVIDGVGDAGDVFLEDCGIVLTDPDAAGSPESPFLPCAEAESNTGLAPPSATLPILEIAWGEAYIDDFGIYGFLSGSNAPLDLDFSIDGDFLNAVSSTFTTTVSNDYSSGDIQLFAGLYDFQSADYFVLRQGDFTLKITAGSQGDDTVREFQVVASNLTFEFLDFNGVVHPESTYVIGLAQGGGLAFVENPPPPPASN